MYVVSTFVEFSVFGQTHEVRRIFSEISWAGSVPLRIYWRCCVIDHWHNRSNVKVNCELATEVETVTGKYFNINMQQLLLRLRK